MFVFIKILTNHGLFWFIFVHSLLYYQFNNTNWKMVDAVFGIQTRGRRMVDVDETTELWWSPNSSVCLPRPLFYSFRVFLVQLIKKWFLYLHDPNSDCQSGRRIRWPLFRKYPEWMLSADVITLIDILTRSVAVWGAFESPPSVRVLDVEHVRRPIQLAGKGWGSLHFIIHGCVCHEVLNWLFNANHHLAACLVLTPCP